MNTFQVLLFLDAHVEVSEGWLEPLVERVFTDRKRVVAPIIDVISDETFEYVTASDTTWGGFNWHLNFRCKLTFSMKWVSNDFEMYVKMVYYFAINFVYF